jgi:hypothetical protein
MKDYTVTLNETQELALEYDTERRATMPMPVMPGDPQPPALTPPEVLQLMVTQHLDALTMQVQGVVDPLVQMARSMTPEHRTALMAALPRTSLVKYMTWRLTQEE